MTSCSPTPTLFTREPQSDCFYFPLVWEPITDWRMSDFCARVPSGCWALCLSLCSTAQLSTSSTSSTWSKNTVSWHWCPSDSLIQKLCGPGLTFFSSLDLDDYGYIKMINFIRSTVSTACSETRQEAAEAHSFLHTVFISKCQIVADLAANVRENRQLDTFLSVFAEMWCSRSGGAARHFLTLGERGLPAAGPSGRPPAADRYNRVSASTELILGV